MDIRSSLSRTSRAADRHHHIHSLWTNDVRADRRRAHACEQKCEQERARVTKSLPIPVRIISR